MKKAKLYRARNVEVVVGLYIIHNFLIEPLFQSQPLKRAHPWSTFDSTRSVATHDVPCGSCEALWLENVPPMVANVYPEIVFNKIRYRRPEQKLKRTVDKVVGHTIMNIHPHSPLVCKTCLIEISQPRLGPIVDDLRGCLWRI